MSEERQSEAGEEKREAANTTTPAGGEGLNETETSVEVARDGEGEEKKEISYNYEELKSTPEVVNISPETQLELQYP